MKKLLFSILLLLLISFVLVSCNNVSDISDESTDVTENPSEESSEAPKQTETPASDFEYEINSEGQIAITKYIGKNSNVIIPDEIDNKLVTQISKQAFRKTAVVSVQMPNNITTIQIAAFEGCNLLETITLSKSLLQIEMYAFENCSLLKNITIPSSVRVIGYGAFMNSGLESIELPQGIEAIPQFAFESTNLTQITVPSSVKIIDSFSFSGCKNLKSITLNKGLVSIGYNAFANNPSLEEIILPESVLEITDMAFCSCPNLKKIMFEGDAPNTFKETDTSIPAGTLGINVPIDAAFTIYYHKDAQGFSSPEWFGYKTKEW